MQFSSNIQYVLIIQQNHTISSMNTIAWNYAILMNKLLASANEIRMDDRDKWLIRFG
jgi:hypothetical protein